jgi:hypothetical protein
MFIHSGLRPQLSLVRSPATFFAKPSQISAFGSNSIKGAASRHFWEKVPSLLRAGIRTRIRILCQFLPPRLSTRKYVPSIYTRQYIHTPVYTHASIYTRQYIHAPVYTRASIYTRQYIHAPVYTRASIYTRQYTLDSIYTRQYIQAPVYTRASIYTRQLSNSIYAQGAPARITGPLA